MIYVHIITEYSEHLLPAPIMSLNNERLKINFITGDKEYRLQYKSIKSIDVVSDGGSIKDILLRIVNNTT